MSEVKSFTDRKGNKVRIGDLIGYFGMKGTLLRTGTVLRITKAGYFISVYTAEHTHHWSKIYIEKMEAQA
jgi:hypothetical protein